MGLSLPARVLWAAGTLRGASNENVIIAGHQRSGTSWLLEMLEARWLFRRLWEPLATFDPMQLGSRLSARPYLRPGGECGDLEAYFANLFAGRWPNHASVTGQHPYSRMRLGWRVLFARGTVLKLCRATRLLPWITDRFEVPVILLMRHPVAVVASALRHPWWTEERVGRHPVVSSTFRHDYPDLAQYVESLDRPEEVLAATWGLDYRTVVDHWPRLKQDVLLVSYEYLVEDPQYHCRRMTAHAGIAPSEDDVSRDHSRPSATTTSDSNVAREGDPRTTWRRRLDDDQVRRILDVVSSLGLEFYTRKPMPESDELETCFGPSSVPGTGSRG